MYRNIKIFTTVIIAFFTVATAQAQDIIHRKNGKTIATKIIEINPDDIKYKTFDQPNGATFTIDVNLVKKVVFENGTVHNFATEASSIDNPELYVGQKRSAYKIGFLTPLFGFTSLGYERNIKPGKSYEIRLNIIGLGRSEETYNNVKPKPFGLGVTGAYKFYHKPDYYSSRQRYAHILKGGYIRPELNITSFAKNRQIYTQTGTTWTPKTERVNTTYTCLMLAFGKQWIFDDSFSVDAFAGIGMGIVSKNKNGFNESFDDGLAYGHAIAENGLAFNVGLYLGLLGK